MSRLHISAPPPENTKQMDSFSKQSPSRRGNRYNVPEKHAVVEHDPPTVSAQQLVDMLNKDDFDATIEADGQEALKKKQPEAVVQSVFHCTGLCCSGERPLIDMLLEPVAGVKKIAYNVSAKQLLVEDHDASVATAQSLLQQLNDDDFGATIQLSRSASCCAAACSKHAPLRWFVLLRGVSRD